MLDDILYLAAPVFAGLLTIGGYFVAQWYASPAIRALRRAPRHAILSFPEGGTGRIVGAIEAYEGKSVRAPLSGRACVAYSVRVSEYEDRGRGSGGWRPIVQDFDGVNFVVADETGRALVRAAGSWPAPVMNRVGGTGLFNGARPALAQFLTDHGQSSRGVLFNRKLRWEEGILSVGMTVAVLGIGRRESVPLVGAPEDSYRESPRRLVIECLDDGQLPMSNAPAVLR